MLGCLQVKAESLNSEMKIWWILLAVFLTVANADSKFSNSNDKPCDSPQYVELETKGIVHCNFSEGYFGVYWYNSTDYANEHPFISIKTSEKPKGGYSSELGKFDIYPNGSLVINNVNFKHARTYTVVKLASPTDEIVPHYVDVIVQASPTPPSPVIDGCNSQNACVMEVGHQGNLTCSVNGIVPSVDLEWRSVDENSYMTFTSSHQHTKPTKYGRFNVTLTSSFHLNHTRGYTFNAECRVIVYEQGPKFDLRSQVILIFSEGQTTSPSGIVPVEESSVAAIVVPLIIFVVGIFVAISIVYLRWKGPRSSNDQRNGRQRTQEEINEEEFLLELTANVQAVNQHLQRTYCNLFGSIEVIPNLQDKRGSKQTEQVDKTVTTIDKNRMDNLKHLEDLNAATSHQDKVSGDSASNNANSLKDAEDDKTSAEVIDVKDTQKDDNMDVGKKGEKQLRLNKSDEENAKGGTIESPADIKVSSTLQVAFTTDRFLIEPTVQVLTSKPGGGTEGIWKNVESVSKVLTDPTIESKSFIIEGEFGYETSTIGKLLAREWAMGRDSSLASCFDVLAVLEVNRIHGDKTIYSEIKGQLHPGHSLTDVDIQSVVRKHDKVALILDYCSKYTGDECKKNPEVKDIIRREILKQCTIILMTTSSGVPNDFIKKFTRLRVNDLLSEIDQETLISQAVFLKNTEDKDKILSLVKESFLLRDILQIPLFFDSFLKMISRYLTNIPKFESMNSFFLRIIFDLYAEGPKAGGDVVKWDNKLGKVALETLTSQHRNENTWRKDKLSDTLGEDVYNFYHHMGVLVEVKVFHWGPQLDQSRNLASEITVKFAHFLFCEWYAAQHLATLAKCHDKEDVKDKVKALLDKDLWYCIRFFCGINEEISREVIEIIEPTVLQLMCTLEAKGSLQSVSKDVNNWCSKEVLLTERDNRIQQMATVQLLEFVSKNEVSQLTLENCFNSVECSSDFLELRSGVRVPVLENLKRLDIIETGRELTEEETTGILTFALRCSKLERVKFRQCIVPETLEEMGISDVSKLKEVEWTPYTDSTHMFHLDRKRLVWKKQNGEKMDDVLYKGLVEKFRENHGIRQKVEG